MRYFRRNLFEDLEFLVQWFKKIMENSNGLRRTDKENSRLLQTVMKDWYELFLQLGAEVDEEITAAEQIELGEWRILDNVLLGKS